jgi:hypothetical protein
MEQTFGINVIFTMSSVKLGSFGEEIFKCFVCGTTIMAGLGCRDQRYFYIFLDKNRHF